MEEEMDYKIGDAVVPMSLPFIKVLKPYLKGMFCDYCFASLQRDNLSKCSGCRNMHYCGKSCQKRDWKEGHSVECKSELFRDPSTLKTVPPPDEDEDSSLLPKLLRTLGKFHRDPSSFEEKHEVFGTKLISFNDLLQKQTNLDMVKGHKPTADFLQALFKKLKDEDTSYKLVEFNLELLFQIFGVWKAYGFEMLLEQQDMNYGTGLYIPHSGIKHSCRPNSIRVMKVGGGNKLEIRCIHPIPIGGEPTVSYLSGNKGPKEREKALKERFNMTCDCELCLEEKESGPLVNYDELKALREELPSGSSFETAVDVRKKLLPLLKKLYHEYDDRITDFCFSAFIILHFWKEHRGNVPNKDLIEFVEDLEKRMRLTYGLDSSLYSMFKERYDSIADILN